jgi:5'-nucleotidase
MKRVMVLIAILAILPLLIVVAYYGPGVYHRLTQSVPSAAEKLAGRPDATRPPPSAAPPAPGLPAPPVEGPTRPPDDVRGEVVQKPFVDERNNNTVIVRSGDTLFDLVVKRYGDSTYMNEVLVANPGLAPSRLRVGQRIVLPPKAKLDRKGQSKAAADDPKIYVVKDQDSLISIARHMYGDSAMATRIFDLNRDQLRTPESLRAGMRLRLPPPPQY